MSYNKEALATLLASLDDKQMQAIFPNAIPVGEKKTEEEPAPSSSGSKPIVDKKDTPATEESSSLKKKIDSVSAPTIETAGDYLALFTRNYIQRDMPKERPFWTPDFRRAFYMLNVYDDQLSQNYYARRQLPAWFVTTSRIYIGILLHMAVLQVQYHVKAIKPEDADLVERFFELYPPSRLPIPGFLMPVFKSLCTSAPEDPRFMRPVPAIPDDFITNATLATRFNDTTKADDFRLPFLPFLFYLHQSLMLDNKDNGATVTYGAADSHSAGIRTVTVPESTTVPYVIDTLLSMKKAVREQFPAALVFPPNVANATATTGYFQIFGTDYAVAANTGIGATLGNVAWSLAKCGLAEPINVHRDLITQFKQNHRLVSLPEFEGTSTFDNMAEMLGFGHNYDWFGDLLETMGTYCAYTKGSGTLEDCSLEGPATGQYLVNLAVPPTLPTRPRYLGDAKSTPPQGGRLSTTRKTEEPLVEALAHMSQVHVRWYHSHPAWADLGSGASRAASFWQIKPIYTSGTTDTGFGLLKSEIKKSILGKLKD